MNIVRFAFLLIFSASFWSCEETPPHIQHIPASAQWVLKISHEGADVATLSETLGNFVSQAEIRNLWNEMLLNSSEYGLTGENSGFVSRLKYENQLFYCLFIEVADNDRWTNKLMGVPGIEFGVKTNYQFAQIDPANWIGWQDDFAIVMHALGYQGRKRAAAFMEKLMQLPAESGLALNDDFMEMATADADAGIFIHEDIWADFLVRLIAEWTLGTVDLHVSPDQIGLLIVQVNEEDDKTLLEVQLSTWLTLLFKKSVPVEMLELVPPTVPDALLGIALDVDILEMLVEQYPVLRRMADEFLQETGVSTTTLLKNWTGELLFVHSPPVAGRESLPGILLRVEDADAFQPLADRQNPDYKVQISDEWLWLSTGDYSLYATLEHSKTDGIPQLVQRWGTTFDSNGLVAYAAKGDNWLSQFGLASESAHAWEARLSAGRLEYVVYGEEDWAYMFKMLNVVLDADMSLPEF